MSVVALEWRSDHLAILDQRRLPGSVVWLNARSVEDVAAAISDMAVRGAPAIGLAAAYGLALAALRGDSLSDAADRLAATRPTAVNLKWALDRVVSQALSEGFEAVLAAAKQIEDEDREANRAIGRHGAELVPHGARILTICNTGSLATGGHGTALGIIRSAYEQGKVRKVYACETRPRLQGARLTAWELMQDGIPFSLIADGAAGSLMARNIDFVVVGADRIAANGDTANKLGTYSLAVLARHHGIPFVVAAPSSTLDPSMPDGSGIPIEERDPREITEIEGVSVAPSGCPAYNPAFDVTPGSLITAIVTETEVHHPPYTFADV
ncbi:MAG TPA: S-methyl-5-thioribose-1-phosphate isomerase [Fimbriimonadaceae bacterium]|nr:S-methyl-5-thioribose-1-phosphate isomerase [Fimbriimonadaceae bacterium]HRJ96299.1 S-methyl-5-thioribose-1-phosphate isomerase [Fimbriimonadaceae bacterium]